MLAVGGIQLAVWAADRHPPFELLSYSADPVQPGETFLIRAHVRRDLHRMCGVKYTRLFFDSRGARYELTDNTQFMNAEALYKMNKINPGRLTVADTVPPHAARGPAQIMTVLDYTCNPVHQVYPISVVLVMDLEVQ